MLKVVFFTPSEADTRRFDDFVEKMRGDVQQSAGGGAMFHAGDGLRYCIGVVKNGNASQCTRDEIASSAALVATMILYVRRLPCGLSWLYCPRGPVWEKPRKDVWDTFFPTITEIARKERAIFLRVEPDEKEIFPQYTPDPMHPWAGISDFKLKFGGSIFRYHPAVEYVFSPMWHFIFLGAKGLRNVQKFFSHRTDFFRPSSGEISPFWKSCSFRLAHGHYQPEYTNMIDLSLSEAEILAQMKPKGRYNIRLAEKKGVRVFSWQWHARSEAKCVFSEKKPKPLQSKRCSSEYPLKSSDAANIFYQLFRETTHRDGFSGHDRAFYENFLRMAGECGMGKMYVAYLPDSVTPDGKVAVATASDQASEANQNEIASSVSRQKLLRRKEKTHSASCLPAGRRFVRARNDRRGDLLVEDDNIPIVAIIVTSFGDRATYFYGASSNVHRDLMAPYLLQWTAILDAKKEGLARYDLFGIAAGGLAQ